MPHWWAPIRVKQLYMALPSLKPKSCRASFLLVEVNSCNTPTPQWDRCRSQPRTCTHMQIYAEKAVHCSWPLHGLGWSWVNHWILRRYGINRVDRGGEHCAQVRCTVSVQRKCFFYTCEHNWFAKTAQHCLFTVSCTSMDKWIQLCNNKIMHIQIN